MGGYEKAFRYEKFLGNLKLYNGDHNQAQHIISNEYDFNSLCRALDGDDHQQDYDDHEEQDDTNDERTMYWKSQESLLEDLVALYYSSSPKWRQVITKHINLARETYVCECTLPEEAKLEQCVKCLRQRVVNQLRNASINATLCTSMWKKTHNIPAGKHEYIQVTKITKGRRKPVCFLIELEFRDEFKMSKSCEEYCNLVHKLPEIYIGKPQDLNAMVRLVCDAAKRSSLEKRIHMGPWRKTSFMQRKWSSDYCRDHRTSSILDRSSAELIGSIDPAAQQCLNTVRFKGLQFSAATAAGVA